MAMMTAGWIQGRRRGTCFLGSMALEGWMDSICFSTGQMIGDFARLPRPE